jgi:hypothetical protein
MGRSSARAGSSVDGNGLSEADLQLDFLAPESFEETTI